MGPRRNRLGVAAREQRAGNGVHEPGAADALYAQEARLIAERDGAAKIAFPADLLARRNQSKIADILKGEENAFLTRKNSLSKQMDILAQRNDENKRQIAGLQSQQDTVE